MIGGFVVCNRRKVRLDRHIPVVISEIAFDLTEGTLNIADGPPCQHTYRRLVIADYFS